VFVTDATKLVTLHVNVQTVVIQAGAMEEVVVGEALEEVVVEAEAQIPNVTSAIALVTWQGIVNLLMICATDVVNLVILLGIVTDLLIKLPVTIVMVLGIWPVSAMKSDPVIDVASKVTCLVIALVEMKGVVTIVRK